MLLRCACGPEAPAVLCPACDAALLVTRHRKQLAGCQGLDDQPKDLLPCMDRARMIRGWFEHYFGKVSAFEAHMRK